MSLSTPPTNQTLLTSPYVTGGHLVSPDVWKVIGQLSKEADAEADARFTSLVDVADILQRIAQKGKHGAWFTDVSESVSRIMSQSLHLTCMQIANKLYRRCKPQRKSLSKQLGRSGNQSSWALLVHEPLQGR